MVLMVLLNFLFEMMLSGILVDCRWWWMCLFLVRMKFLGCLLF